MDISRDDILREFEVEAEEHLASMEQSLVALDTHPEDSEILRAIFRNAHTLKGAAACVGFTALADFAHGLEGFLERLWKHDIAVSPELITLLLESIDLWRELVPAALAGVDELPAKHTDFLRELAARAAGGGRPAPKAEPQASAASGATAETEGGGKRARTLRVPVEQVDKLVNLTGELTIVRGRMGSLLARTDLDAHATLEALRDINHEAERLYTELQEQVMKLRMVPVGPAFRQHIRTVRDIAVAQGKQARLVLEGEEIEIDMAVLENIRDPLLHLVRNALDHGIEPPEERRQQGKEPVGTVAMRARYDSGSVVIEVADDGGGLDRERIAARARERGLLAAEGTPSEAEIFRCIFLPGFSTAEKVSKISGRGIGLDVVSRNVEGLRGSVSVASTPERGTSVTLRVPLTVAVIQGFSVGVGSETYILPLDAVIECIELPTGQSRDEGQGVINLRGRPLPYVRLGNVFGLASPPGHRESVVVVRHEAGEAGLAVDALYGEGQVVVKPLAKVFQKIPGVFGSALLGDGRVGLILDVSGLMRSVLTDNGAAIAASEPVESPVTAQP